ncbi:hypothetical protein ACXXDK_04590 [Deinococcus sp. PESE-38]
MPSAPWHGSCANYESPSTFQQSPPGPALLLSAGLLAAGLAGAQITIGKLNLAGKEVQSANLYGAEYASRAALDGLLDIEREGDVMRVIGMGHTMLLPIDTDQVRATTDFNTVQIDTERVKARTATWVNGVVYFPLDTLARAAGAPSTAPAPSRWRRHNFRV